MSRCCRAAVGYTCPPLTPFLSLKTLAPAALCGVGRSDVLRPRDPALPRAGAVAADKHFKLVTSTQTQMLGAFPPKGGGVTRQRPPLGTPRSEAR